MGNIFCDILTLVGQIGGSAIETKDFHATYYDHDYDLHGVKFIDDNGTPHVIQWGRAYFNRDSTVQIFYLFPESDYQAGGGMGISGYGNDKDYTNGLKVKERRSDGLIVKIYGKAQWVKFIMVDRPF